MNTHIKNHKVIPRKDLWHRIENNLDGNSAKRDVKYYKNISIAAILVAMVSVSILMTHYFKFYAADFNEEYVVSNLDTQNGNYDYLYAQENIESLDKAYGNAQNKDLDILKF